MALRKKQKDEDLLHLRRESGKKMIAAEWAEEPAEEDPEAAAAAAAEKAARAAYIDQVNKEQTEGTKGIVGKVVALVITGGSFAFLLYVFDPNVCAFLAPVKDACRGRFS